MTRSKGDLAAATNGDIRQSHSKRKHGERQLASLAHHNPLADARFDLAIDGNLGRIKNLQRDDKSEADWSSKRAGIFAAVDLDGEVIAIQVGLRHFAVKDAVLDGTVLGRSSIKVKRCNSEGLIRQAQEQVGTAILSVLMVERADPRERNRQAAGFRGGAQGRRQRQAEDQSLLRLDGRPGDHRGAPIGRRETSSRVNLTVAEELPFEAIRLLPFLGGKRENTVHHVRRVAPTCPMNQERLQDNGSVFVDTSDIADTLVSEACIARC